MDYHCFGQTDRISITMEDFYYICKKYLNDEISEVLGQRGSSLSNVMFK